MQGLKEAVELIRESGICAAIKDTAKGVDALDTLLSCADSVLAAKGLPEKRLPDDGQGDEDTYNAGFNSCRDLCAAAYAGKEMENKRLREALEKLTKSAEELNECICFNSGSLQYVLEFKSGISFYVKHYRNAIFEAKSALKQEG